MNRKGARLPSSWAHTICECLESSKKYKGKCRQASTTGHDLERDTLWESWFLKPKEYLYHLYCPNLYCFRSRVSALRCFKLKQAEITKYFFWVLWSLDEQLNSYWEHVRKYSNLPVTSLNDILWEVGYLQCWFLQSVWSFVLLLPLV